MDKARKVAIVTGASQGIGAALVQALGSRDYRVIANSRSIKTVDNSDVVAVPGDVADPQTAERVVREALNRFGRIDTLVNNAGIFMAKPFTAYSKDDYAAYLATNVTGFFHMTQSVMETMVKQGSGHVVSITTSLVGGASIAKKEAARDKNYVCMIVSDTGVGIEGKMLPRIFDPFFKTRSSGHGAGLGLAIAYDLVRRVGGDIRVEEDLEQVHVTYAFPGVASGEDRGLCLEDVLLRLDDEQIGTAEDE